ncbi:unnamed protein product [Dibothriocephalus latus]|uniref:PDZ domain-containing protein n=1 Tax=Dibothriocephalus latus TaxID=60516 RepID=A0A3P7LHN4_DIBLA|nr:unnamed protein product [Dibothriocephalus latus]
MAHYEDHILTKKDFVRQQQHHQHFGPLPPSSLPLPITSSVPALLFEITLFRSSRGFGFSIRGGHEFNQMPLTVLRIAEGGSAFLDGRLRVRVLLCPVFLFSRFLFSLFCRLNYFHYFLGNTGWWALSLAI